MNQRRLCPEVDRRQNLRCPLPENHSEPCQFGDVRRRIPLWLRRGHLAPNGLSKVLER